MGSSKKQIIGYKYSLGMHSVLCHGPIDKITKIEFDNKVAWSGESTGGNISISAPSLFGGESREGGVAGTINVDMGGPSQTPNSYLVSKLGNMVPAFRGVVSLVFNQFYMGMNPYIKPPSFWASRIHVRGNGVPQWYDAKSAIGEDMNPAHIIRECITDSRWGMGYLDADIDDTSFTQAADQLYDEGMGISLLWDASLAIEDFIKEILRHIDGSLFVDRTTGKFVLKLVRDDYSVGTLLHLDENSVEKITDFKRSTIDELINSVTVIYWDGTTGENNSVTVQDIALIGDQQGENNKKLEFPGFTNGTLATKVAERSLRALSSPLASCILYTNRLPASLNIGDVFTLSWSDYGISSITMRVTNIELGALDSNLIKINAIEDVFSISSNIYSPPADTGWSSPSNEPAPCPQHNVIEAPYWELVQILGESAVQQLDPTSGFVVATGTKPSDDAISISLMSNPYSTGYEEYDVTDFCPTATILSDITEMQSVWSITGSDLDLVDLNTYALIDNEIVSVLSISNSSVTVGRGVLDTVPTKHSAGARIFFSDTSFGTDRFEYSLGETARIKLLPSTGKGTLDISLAPAQTVVIQGRQYKPYPPGNFKINTQYYPDKSHGPLTTSWAHRDRLQQTAMLVDTTAGNIGPEVGTTYSMSVEGNPSSWTTLKSVSGISTTSWDWATEDTDVLDGTSSIQRIRLKSVRDGINSYQEHTVIVERCGLGYNLGNYLGG